ncbi:MAG TPA: DEAD/DEAH box helicase [Kofleriaceae bacterium]|nr:DEAD/DEAH box helicase [Kofleriaceae bacterium]
MAGWFRERFGGPTEPQRAGWPRIGAGEDVLIAAPTGSGKTLAAFLACMDELVRRGLEAPLGDHTAILYISPLKALSNDVQRNLESPLAELTRYAAERGVTLPEIRVAVRTGDTPASERAKMAKRPPHILVTTPESLFILLTSEKGRASLGELRTVIVDEIHAIAGDKRGAHLAISLERLDRLVTQICGRAPTRVGLSATQRPIERIARLLVGTRRPLPFIADAGHRRELDLQIEITDDELGAVASNEQFGRVYDRIAELVTQHRSTIVFVNTRRLVERAAAALEQRLGEEHVVAHHGSMSRALRLAAEQKLKHGQVKCAVATASLELGIDVGAVDLVIQLGSPRSIATLLQRVGRSGHTLGGTPKGRLFALTRDQLAECAALIRGVRRGNLDEIGVRDAPLDILAQQIVAICGAEEIREDELGTLIRGATPYASLDDRQLEQILTMLSEGVSHRRGRTGAHIHRDRIAGRLRGRRGARLAAITSGGAIPDNNNYTVVQWPEEIQVGTVDEDFAIDSSAGDIFQLGNTAWKIRRIEAGKVIVEDARGLPPTIPFWFGEAPARTKELSDEISDLRGEVDRRIEAGEPMELVAAWLAREASMSLRAAQQLVAYWIAARAALGALPRKDLLIAERFFDEGGGMQLVLHAPLGGRINRAWGLALRKKFCRTFDFELQALATDDGIVISLGQPHSFALETVFGFVPSHSAEDTLVQALLDRPMFEIRWRWNVTRSLTVLRRRNGKKVPPHLIKMRAADTLSVVFPAAQACPENLPGSMPGMPGNREIPDHPLVFETIRDCLVEAMDVEGLRELIERLERGDIQVLARDTVEPSPLSHELLNANPYAFLDDAPLEDRRTRAVALRRGLPAMPDAAGEDIGVLDADAIRAASEEVQPIVRDADELHDALMALWLVPETMGLALGTDATRWFEALANTGRAIRVSWADNLAWVATERIGAIRNVLGDAVACMPPIPTPSWAERPDRETAIVRIVGAHLDHRGPVSTRALAIELGLPITEVLVALLALEGDGAILRGSFTSAATISPARHGSTLQVVLDNANDSDQLHDLEWCNRRVLARIHRLTLARLRKEIEPVSAAALMRFLLRWQRVARNTQLIGADGLARIVEQLQGFETAAGAWEREVLPARLCGYDASWLDQMCLAGQIVWCRLSPRKPTLEPEADAAEPTAEPTPEPAAKPKKPGRVTGRLVQPDRDLYRDSYDLAEAAAEAARLAGSTRDQIAAAATAAISGKVPVRPCQVITSLVTATAMLRNEHRGEPTPLARGTLPGIPCPDRDARYEALEDELATLSTEQLLGPQRTMQFGERAEAPGPKLRLDPRAAVRKLAPDKAREPVAKPSRTAPSRSAPLALMLRRDVTWLRAAAAIDHEQPPLLSPPASLVRDHLQKVGASFLPDLATGIDLAPDEIEDALWELVGAGLATADGFASLRVLVDRKRGEVKSHFDRTTAVPAPTSVRSWQDAIRKARYRDRARPDHALRSLPTAAGRWSLLPPTSPDAIDAEASARQLLHRYGVVFRDLLARESCLPPWRDLLVALRRLEARGEIRGGRFVHGFVGEQFALPEALDELRAARHPSSLPEACKVAATDPLNLVGVLAPGPRVPALVGNAVLYLDGQAVASLEAGTVVHRASLPPGSRLDDDLTYHPPPRPAPVVSQAHLPL